MTDQERPGFGDDDMVRTLSPGELTKTQGFPGSAPSEVALKRIAIVGASIRAENAVAAALEMPSSTSWEDNFPPPFWAERKAHGQLERGAQLCTRDGRRIGNAWIMGSRRMEEPARTLYMIYTDIGTKLLLSDREIGELFYPPSWIGNSEALNEVRQAAARKAQRL